MYDVAMTTNSQAKTFTVTAKMTGRTVGYIVHDLHRNIWRVWKGAKPGTFVNVQYTKDKAIRSLLVSLVG